MIRFRKAWKILGICLVLLVCSCSGKDKSKHINYRLSGEDELQEALSALKEAPDDVTLNISIWYYFTERGMWDSVIRYAAPVFHRTLFSPEKEQLMLYSGAYASQAFIFSERFDSLGTYLDRIIPISEEKGDDFLRAMVNNIAGLYAIKITGDYAEALERYKQALQAVQNTRDTINQSILLGNIASIYYHRRDTAGYRYASEAYRLARLSTDHYSMTYSALQLSQMLYLKKEYASAAAYLEEVAGIATGYPQFHAQFHLLQANMYADRDDYAKAEYYYRKALDTQEHTEPGVMASIHLDYCKMLWKQGRTDKASEILLKGLSISDSIGSIEYKHELLLALSELSSATGRKDEALEYYKKYHGYAEKLFGIQKERAFQRLENEEERSALKDEINRKEIALEHEKRKNIMALAITCTVFAILAALYAVYRKQRKMYRQLVEVYQQYLNRSSLIRKSASQSDGKDKDTMLWEKIESLMRDGKAYRQNDISLENIAETLSTNRVYISKAINRFSGMSFYKYINSYRIEEAVAALSDDSTNIPMKALADKLGYNSLSAFYRAFQAETGCPPSKYRAEARKLKISSEVFS